MRNGSTTYGRSRDEAHHHPSGGGGARAGRLGPRGARLRRQRHADRAEGDQDIPGCEGSAKFKSTAEERELQVEVEHIRRLVGKRVAYFVGGKRLASAKVNRFGAAEINRNSERGQFVPAVRAGTAVKVKTLGGTLIVRGSF